MKGINILNDIKIGFKVIGCFGLIFAVVAVMMLSGTKVRMDAVRGVDSMYRQYIESIRETGELKAGIEKMEAYLYHYVAMPSARNNTLAAVRNLNDYNTSRNEADIKATVKGRGGWSGILLLFSVAGVLLLI